ncbi:MAG TPA: MerR family DNA-binding transcriptional regulator [Cycloclasticus sp.]|jgi:DNA-binding transcriptional MerR regulator|nr:MerR family DNA-binding transcriptional regulator [Cycloclasticus sp.]HIL91954.1 MerR family DNA-binding transcriptional regulator [Cycloclasticus sp.]
MSANIKESLYTATELATSLGVTSRTLRFYETKHLIQPKRVGNRRVYNYKDRARMQLILRGKRIGFPLDDIKEFLDLYDSDADRTPQIQLLVNKVENRIKQLTEQQQDIETTLDELREIHSIASETLKNKPKIRWSST